MITVSKKIPEFETIIIEVTKKYDFACLKAALIRCLDDTQGVDGSFRKVIQDLLDELKKLDEKT